MQEKMFRLMLETGIIILLSSILWAANPSQSKLDIQLKSLVRHGSVLIANEQQVLYRYPPNKNPLLIPASVLKYATALSALHYFGSEYSFNTEFYIDQNHSLVIKGKGDPFLVSEEWQRIAQQISLLPDVPKKMQGLFFDTSLFSEKIKIPGISFSNNPFDAHNGALVVNFNTVFVKVDSKGHVTSAEKQTPLTPLARSLAKKLSPGTHRISIQPNLSFTYSGELIKSFFRKEGFSFENKNVALRSVRNGDHLFYTHSNILTLKEVIAGMLRFSNNFTANQLLLTVGLQRYGPPATLEKGTRALTEYLRQEVKLPKEQFKLVEGSGISRKNRLTPEAIWQLLKDFAPYQDLLQEDNGVLLKTGTLRGVYTMAGYLPGTQPLYFAILLNQSQNYRNKILQILLSTDFSAGKF